jgi:hypothetical protein
LGPLASLVSDVLADRRTVERPWADAKQLRDAWFAFQGGDARPEGEIVRAVLLELWARQYIDVDHRAPAG